MPNFNSIILVGHVGQDATVKTFDNGSNVINFTLAVSDKWTGKDGQEHGRTDWFDCQYFAKSTKVAEYIRKGAAVMVSGQMQSRQYEKDGVKRTAWAVNVRELNLVSGKSSGADAGEIQGATVAEVKAKIDKRKNEPLPF